VHRRLSHQKQNLGPVYRKTRREQAIAANGEFCRQSFEQLILVVLALIVSSESKQSVT
jgi:hypothetical protein